MENNQHDNLVSHPLSSVMEDYLEAIYDLNKQKTVVRVKDIAHSMDVKMPTVSSMLKALNAKGLVNYKKYEYVELTPAGLSVGRAIRYKHKVLLKFLTEILNIEFSIADQEACKMEHALSADTLDSLIAFMDFIQTCPMSENNWSQCFAEYRLLGHRTGEGEIPSR